MTNNQKFVEASKRERALMSAFLEGMGNTNYTFSPDDSYAKWDCIFTNKSGTKYLAEIKVRNNTHNKYSTTILETAKVQALREEAKRIGATPIGVFFFTDNKVGVANLEVARPTSSWQANAHTVLSNNKIEKSFVEIPITHLKLFTLNN